MQYGNPLYWYFNGSRCKKQKQSKKFFAFAQPTFESSSFDISLATAQFNTMRTTDEMLGWKLIDLAGHYQEAPETSAFVHVGGSNKVRKPLASSVKTCNPDCMEVMKVFFPRMIDFDSISASCSKPGRRGLSDPYYILQYSTYSKQNLLWNLFLYNTITNL